MGVGIQRVAGKGAIKAPVSTIPLTPTLSPGRVGEAVNCVPPAAK